MANRSDQIRLDKLIAVNDQILTTSEFRMSLIWDSSRFNQSHCFIFSYSQRCLRWRGGAALFPVLHMWVWGERPEGQELSYTSEENLLLLWHDFQLFITLLQTFYILINVWAKQLNMNTVLLLVVVVLLLMLWSSHTLGSLIVITVLLFTNCY